MTASFAFAAPVPTAARVAVLLPTLDGGGAERSMLAVTSELSRRGYDAELVVGQLRGDLADLVPPDLAIVDLDQPHLRRCLPVLVRYLQRRRPDVLIATLEHAIFVADLAVRLSGVDTAVVPRLANTLSEQEPARAGSRGRLVERGACRVYRRAACTIAVSRGAAEDLHHVAGVPMEQLCVVPNPVVGPELWSGMRASLDHPWFRPGTAPVILGIGRLTPQKNFGLLIEAFARIRERRDARLVILGEGALRTDLREAAAQAGVARDVDLPGFDPNPFRYLARAAVHVLSSDWEGLPGSLIQALACGVPVVATDCPSGPREILDHGRFGRLVPVGDATALAAAVDATLAGGRTAVPAGAWQRFAVADAVDGYERVIHRALRRDRTGAAR